MRNKRILNMPKNILEAIDVSTIDALFLDQISTLERSHSLEALEIMPQSHARAAACAVKLELDTINLSH
jgi:hypothetical protein